MRTKLTRRECLLGGISFVAGTGAFKFAGFASKAVQGSVSGYSEAIRRSIVKIVIKSEPSGFGTGFCIARDKDSAECVIATASHVVDGGRIDSLVADPASHVVLARDGSSDIMRRGWCQEKWMDICAFHSQLKLQPLELADELPAIGETIYAVGFTEDDSYEVNIGSFSDLIVSGSFRFTTTSRAVPGMSGGPILNSRGQVVGMVVTGSHQGNLAGAVPLHELQNLRERMRFVDRADSLHKTQTPKTTGIK